MLGDEIKYIAFCYLYWNGAFNLMVSTRNITIDSEEMLQNNNKKQDFHNDSTLDFNEVNRNGLRNFMEEIDYQGKINDIYWEDNCTSNKEIFVNATDMYILSSQHSPDPYTCSQKFRTNNATSELHLYCYSIYFVLDCKYESFTVSAAGKVPQTLCGPQSPIEFTGTAINIVYQRKLFGLHGGYTCLLVSKFIYTTCGISGDNLLSDRIVGGVDVPKYMFPWMAVLNIQGRTQTSVCGGTLISNSMVLTAAKCVTEALSIKVGLGTINSTQNMTDTDSVWLTSKNFTIHEKFDSSILRNDIAIINLPEEVAFTKAIRTICLPGEMNDYINYNSTALGYGSVIISEPKSTTLKSVELQIWLNSQCQSVWEEYSTLINDTEICAYALLKDRCTGDNGGPLMIKENGKWLIVGIISFGYECATFGVPSVNTRVSKYLPWIYNRLQKKKTTII